MVRSIKNTTIKSLSQYLISLTGNAVLLIATQVIEEECGIKSNCGPLHKEHYYQIIISVSCAIQILLLLIYLSEYMTHIIRKPAFAYK